MLFFLLLFTLAQVIESSGSGSHSPKGKENRGTGSSSSLESGAYYVKKISIICYSYFLKFSYSRIHFVLSSLSFIPCFCVVLSPILFFTLSVSLDFVCNCLIKNLSFYYFLKLQFVHVCTPF